MRHKGNLLRDDRGATAIEYGLICSLIVIGMFGALSLFAGSVTGMINNVSTEVVNVT